MRVLALLIETSGLCRRAIRRLRHPRSNHRLFESQLDQALQSDWSGAETEKRNIYPFF